MPRSHFDENMPRKIQPSYRTVIWLHDWIHDLSEANPAAKKRTCTRSRSFPTERNRVCISLCGLFWWGLEKAFNVFMRVEDAPPPRWHLHGVTCCKEIAAGVAHALRCFMSLRPLCVLCNRYIDHACTGVTCQASNTAGPPCAACHAANVQFPGVGGWYPTSHT